MELLPVLIGRMARGVAPGFQLRIVRLVRTHGQRIVLPGRLEHAVETAARKTGDTGRILDLLDSNGIRSNVLSGPFRSCPEPFRRDPRICDDNFIIGTQLDRATGSLDDTSDLDTRIHERHPTACSFCEGCARYLDCCPPLQSTASRRQPEPECNADAAPSQ